VTRDYQYDDSWVNHSYPA